MNYEEFKERFTEEIQDLVKMHDEDIELQPTVISKVNRKCDAISVGTPGEIVRPIINITEAYKQSDGNVKEIAESMWKNALEAMEIAPKIPDFTLENAKSHLYCEVVNIEKNNDMLKDVAYRPIGDVALIARWDVMENGSTLVTKGLCDRIGITQEEALELAYNRTLTMDYNIRDMMSVMSGILFGEDSDMQLPKQEGPSMYVITCNDNPCGAVAIAVPEVMENVSKELGGDFYILPSSRYEVIAIPKDVNSNVRELEEMVQSINRTELDEKDFLSDRVYQYDSKSRSVSMAEPELPMRTRAKCR